MDTKTIEKLLRDIKAGKVKVSQGMKILRSLPYEDLGFAKLDTHRKLRCGFWEVIFCKGKTIPQISQIVRKFLQLNHPIMATKASEDVYQAIKRINHDAFYHQEAQIVTIGKPIKRKNSKTILIVTAGTADISIAKEAQVTAQIMGNRVESIYDVGVAGMHRLLRYKESLFKANVIIVIAGMEGALASVVSGLVNKPVIAVPTSIGYGASFKGLAALLSMLNCCAPGVSVVNIDNGFGAGYFASMINGVRPPL